MHLHEFILCFLLKSVFGKEIGRAHVVNSLNPKAHTEISAFDRLHNLNKLVFGH